MGRRIYKFQDTIDFECAFIVADSFFDAEQFIKGETALEVVYVKDVPIEDFPKANLNKTPPYVWQSRILPF